MVTRLRKQYHGDRTAGESTLYQLHNPRHQWLQSQPAYSLAKTSSVLNIRFMIFEDQGRDVVGITQDPLR